MIQHNFAQGSVEWRAHRATHFNASDAPAMLGLSPYKTRDQLLHEYATGIVQDVDAATQNRFDEGHRIEALARPLAEKLIGEPLYPIVGSIDIGPLHLSASFDGITLAEDIVWEHKTLSDRIKRAATAAELPEDLRVQMEHQLIVANANNVLFLATEWNGETLIDKRHHWYQGDPALARRILDGWEQFARDLENYAPPVVAPEIIAEPIMALPALSIQVNGAISLISNLDVFGGKLRAFVDGLNREPETDQEFADAEAAIKTLEKAQGALEAAESSALAQTASIDEMRRTVELYIDLARSTRLAMEKLVKARKESLRAEAVLGGKRELDKHIALLNAKIGKFYMPSVAADFAGAIKGKKTMTSIREAIATELERGKSAANEIADKIQINLNSLRELANNHAFLFPDTEAIVRKEPDDVIAIIKSRLAEHEAKEAKRLETERERIRAEEEAKAQQKMKAEQDRIRKEEEAKATPVTRTVAKAADQTARRHFSEITEDELDEMYNRCAQAAVQFAKEIGIGGLSQKGSHDLYTAIEKAIQGEWRQAREWRFNRSGV